MDLRLSKHAECRMKSRGISAEVASLVYAYGQVEHHRGRSIYRLTKTEAMAAANDVYGPSPASVEKLTRVYLVVSDGELVTAAHRTKRHKGNRK